MTPQPQSPVSEHVCGGCPCRTPDCDDTCFEEPFSRWLAVNLPDISISDHLFICKGAADVAVDVYCSRPAPTSAEAVLCYCTLPASKRVECPCHELRQRVEQNRQQQERER